MTLEIETKNQPRRQGIGAPTSDASVGASEEKWDNFVLTGNGEFLQSFKWGELKEKLGNKVWYLSVKDEREKVAQALIIETPLPINKKYFYCPRGPIFLSSSQEKKERAVRIFLMDLKNKAQKEKALFFRFEPNFGLDDLNLKKIFSDLKIHYQLIESVQPRETSILDLRKEEKELLSEMHHKTRYNVRLAERHGVKISPDGNLKIFLDLLRETARREHLKIYPDHYYFNLIKELPVKIYFASYQNKILAANLILFWNKTAIYLYGGSSRENKEVMAPYLLHWEIIKEAKKNGFLYYDFWGIDEKKCPGLTRFKLGFGGKRIKYPQSYDLIFDKFWYFLYQIGSKIRRSLD